MPHRIHIISFDIPFPANYGGVIVVYYHLKKLAEKGVKVILHCFEYGDRSPQSILLDYCEAVYYYPRSRALYHQFSTVPFIVKTRQNPTLLKRLLADDYPILMEGLHCAGFINHPALANRLKLLRMHNIEWQYYRNLAQLEKRWLHKLYLYLESQKLRRYEQKNIAYADQILSLTQLDATYFAQWSDQVQMIGPFHAHEKVTSRLGRGNYILFHGKLSVEDNEKAAIYLIEKVMPFTDAKLIVAGMNPNPTLQVIASEQDNVEVIANPSESEMLELIRAAQVNVLLSFQVAGIKLKLLNALFLGRHCLVNPTIVEGTALADLCTIAVDPNAFVQKIDLLWSQDFTTALMDKRKIILQEEYSNEVAARKTIKIVDIGKK
ncbi:MAG: hypothetical protein AB8G15_05485 [Saprospiraceae bacterium]